MFENNLSAIGSRSSPNFDSAFSFLANNPSKKSLIAPSNITINAITFSLLFKESTNMGIQRILKKLKILGI
jgi:hypothetical protein